VVEVGGEKVGHLDNGESRNQGNALDPNLIRPGEVREKRSFGKGPKALCQLTGAFGKVVGKK